ncbi:MAG: hypothetical protein QMD13_01100 [Candidatus Bathyarchaeia archaeon]|nr:hypothetical protein [Candidatus Bathyarchaeia archaeon]
MNDSSLVNATSIWLHFLPVPLQSLLVYEFNNTDAADARAIADTLTLTINTAFQTTFTWNSTRTSDSIANVTYTGPGKANLTEYTEWLMPRCLASDLRGFSLTFLPMTRLGANLIVTASKDSGGFEWGYMMMTTHLTWIPVGSNSHKIDILDLLNVDSLEPSPYALTPEGTYSSMVMLIISSNETVLYAGCEPGLINPPTQFRGWMYQLLTPQPP